MVATCGQARVASTSFTIQFPMARGKKAETNGIEWKPRGYNRVAFYPGNDSNQAPVVIEQEVKGTVVRNFLHGREDKKYGYGLHVEIGVEDVARIKDVIATDHLSSTKPQYKWPVSEQDNVRSEDKKYGYGLHVEIGVEDVARIKDVIATDHLSSTKPQYKWPVSEQDNV